MADNIAYDIVDGSGGRKTRTGWILDRIATVYNIDVSVPASKVILYAVDVLNAGDLTHEPILIGSEHPDREGLYLSDFELAGIDPDAVKVRLVYKEYPFADQVRRVGATTSQVVTNRGYFINPDTGVPWPFLSDMQVKYTFPADYEGVNKEKYAGKEFTTGAESTKLSPESTIVITRQVRIGETELSRLARDFVGKVNKSGWLLAPDDPAYTWLCTGIEGISNDNGSSYVITYSFQYREDYWMQTVLYIDPNTGRPPSDVDYGEGVVPGSKNSYTVQELAEFNILALA